MPSAENYEKNNEKIEKFKLVYYTIQIKMRAKLLMLEVKKPVCSFRLSLGRQT